MQKPPQITFDIPSALKRFGKNGFVVMDFETRATVDLKVVGVDVYSRHHETEMACLAFVVVTVEGANRGLWLRWQPGPRVLFEAISKGFLIWAHNVWFERCIWENIAVVRFGWPPIDPKQYRCSMAKANAASLPGKLEDLSKGLDLAIKKDMTGHSLMLKLSKPRPPRQADKKAFILDNYPELSKAEAKAMLKDKTLVDRMPTLWREHPEDLKRQAMYCQTDVEAELCAMIATPDQSEKELSIWLLDQRINSRGIPIDKQTVLAALKCLDIIKAQSANDIKDLTNGVVTSADRVAKLIEFCASRGVNLPNCQADTITAFLKQDLPGDVRQVLEIRQLMAKASMKKYASMSEHLCEGVDRVTAGLMYFGANKSGRWSSLAIQLHNMVRGEIHNENVIEYLIECVRALALDMLRLVHDPVTTIFSSLTRSMICAPDDSIFCCADFSAIEARVAFWVAGQKDALAIIQNNDDNPGQNPDIYTIEASRIYAKPAAEVTSAERQVGKMVILGFQYGMAENAFQEQCLDIWGIDLKLEFCLALKDAYRGKYLEVVKTWRLFDQAFKAVIRDRGKVRVRNFVFEARGRFVLVHLPSGRALRYYNCQIKKVTKTNEKGESWTVDQISYWGRDSKSKQYKRLGLYGAKIFQHTIQALARDIMAEAMLRVDPSYPVVLTVHDEILSEIKLRNFGTNSLEYFISLMSQKPTWAKDCPIKSSGWAGKRFKK